MHYHHDGGKCCTCVTFESRCRGVRTCDSTFAYANPRILPQLSFHMGIAVTIYKLIADGSFGPDEIAVMKAAYEAALIDVGVTDRETDPITELIAKAIINVTASGERNLKQVIERALNEAFLDLAQRYPTRP
jgi:hypothetical protein